MTKDEAKKALENGYYGDTMETDECIGMIVRHFPDVYSEDLTLEEMVAEALYGPRYR